MNTVSPIFKDPQLQSLFEGEGFVKVPLLNSQQVDELQKLFDETSKEHAVVKGLHHTTTDTESPELIYKVDARIKEIFLPELDKLLIDYKTLVGSFHIKEPGTGSATGTHQDPTFVDESKYCSANIWVAMHDVDAGNGNLYFVNGSNRAITSLRVTPGYPSYYQSFSNYLTETATQVPLKRGEAVIFSNATIHGATDNLSDKIRLACTLMVCNKPADWILYFQEKNVPNDKIEKYILDLESFVTMPKDGRPVKTAFSEFISYQYPQITKAEFLKRLGKSEKPNENYFKKIMNIFRVKDSV